jgi:uncharacterized phosphosugar-binding protein
VYLLNTVLAEAVEVLTAEGVQIDVYQSANSEPADSAAAMIARWRGRVHGL